MTEPCPFYEVKVVNNNVTRLRELLHKQSTDYQLSRSICVEMVKLVKLIIQDLNWFYGSVFFDHVASMISEKREEVDDGDYKFLEMEAKSLIERYDREFQ